MQGNLVAKGGWSSLAGVLRLPLESSFEEAVPENISDISLGCSEAAFSAGFQACSHNDRY